MGDIEGDIIDVQGNIMPATFKNVSYSPKLAYNLFSITTSINYGMTLSNKGKTLTLTANQNTIKFDRVVNIKSGFLSGFQFLPKADL